MSVAEQIESYLRERQCWVSAAELCARFQIAERDLRARDDHPGLCSDFAISGNHGFRHIACATDEEFARSNQRLRLNGIRQIITARRRRKARSRLLTPKPEPVAERATGQFLLLAP